MGQVEMQMKGRAWKFLLLSSAPNHLIYSQVQWTFPPIPYISVYIHTEKLQPTFGGYEPLFYSVWVSPFPFLWWSISHTIIWWSSQCACLIHWKEERPLLTGKGTSLVPRLKLLTWKSLPTKIPAWTNSYTASEWNGKSKWNQFTCSILL